MENEASRLRASKGLVKWVAIAGAVAILAPVGVQAAAQKVVVKKGKLNTVEQVNKIGGTTKVKGTTNVPQLGLFGTSKVNGAVRNQPVPAGFIGGGDCLNTDDPLGQAQASTVTIPADGGKTVVQSIIITGRSPLPTDAGADTEPNGIVLVSTDAIQNPPGSPVNLLEARVNAENPNVTVDLGSGLALTDDLHLTGRAPGGGNNGDCQFAVLGYVRTAALGG